MCTPKKYVSLLISLKKVSIQPGQLSPTLSLYLELDSLKVCFDSDISRSRVHHGILKGKPTGRWFVLHYSKDSDFPWMTLIVMVPRRHFFAKPLDIHPWLSMFSSDVSINKWILFFTCMFNLYHMRVEFIFFTPNNGNTTSVILSLSSSF